MNRSCRPCAGHPRLDSADDADDTAANGLMRGHFITFEGGEGSGKSTHAATLAQRLKSLGLEVVLTREPGGSPGAEIIRHILLSGIAKPLGAETEAILFAAARDDHVRKHHPAGARRRPMGDLRPLHRFHPRLSGRARQGRSAADPQPRARHGRRRQARSHLHPRRAGDRRSGARQAAARQRRGRPLRGRGASSFTRSCARPIAMLAAKEPKRIVVIDGRAPREVVAERIWDVVKQRLHPAKALAAPSGQRRERRRQRRARCPAARAKRWRCSATPRPSRRCSRPTRAAASRMPG